MKTDLEILQELASKTLKARAHGPLTADDLIRLLTLYSRYRESNVKVESNDPFADDVTYAVMHETCHTFDYEFIESLKNQNIPITIDCTNVPTDPISFMSGAKALIDEIEKTLINHPIEKTFLVVSPMALTIFQASVNSEFRRDKDPESFKDVNTKLCGRFNEVPVYCWPYATDDTLIVSNFGKITTLTPENISFI